MRGKKSKKKTNKNYLGMLVISMVALVLLGVFMVQAQTLERRLHVYNTKIEALEEQLKEEKQRAEDMEDVKAYMSTDEYVESVARDKLGLVKENEIVFREKE